MTHQSLHITFPSQTLTPSQQASIQATVTTALAGHTVTYAWTDHASPTPARAQNDLEASSIVRIRARTVKVTARRVHVHTTEAR